MEKQKKRHNERANPALVIDEKRTKHKKKKKTNKKKKRACGSNDRRTEAQGGKISLVMSTQNRGRT